VVRALGLRSAGHPSKRPPRFAAARSSGPTGEGPDESVRSDRNLRARRHRMPPAVWLRPQRIAATDTRASGGSHAGSSPAVLSNCGFPQFTPLPSEGAGACILGGAGPTPASGSRQPNGCGIADPVHLGANTWVGREGVDRGEAVVKPRARGGSSPSRSHRSWSTHVDAPGDWARSGADRPRSVQPR
jgi:hypothetical protein